MVSVAKLLDADELAALAAYYGSLPEAARKAKNRAAKAGSMIERESDSPNA